MAMCTYKLDYVPMTLCTPASTSYYYNNNKSCLSQLRV